MASTEKNAASSYWVPGSATNLADLAESNPKHVEAGIMPSSELGVAPGTESSDVPPCPAHTTERKLVRRIDLHLLPACIILYLLAFLDRVNMGNARSFSLNQDPDLTGIRYNTALTIFFVPYIIFEVPSNIFLKRFSPRLWLSLCMIGFGVVTVFSGIVPSYSGLLTTRFFLGLFESGMFPGCFYLMGMWYKRNEAQRRFSLFFCSTAMAGAFGGLLAYGIGRMDGLRGYHGWRWIFIIEGCISFFFGFLFLFVFPSFPEEAKWLREDEREYIKGRLRADHGHSAAERKLVFRDVLTVMRDTKIWLGGFMYFGMIVPAYAYAFFSPTIIQTYHYGPVQTQLISVPPWVAAFVFAMVNASISDRLRHRVLFAVGPLLIAIAGIAVLMTVHDRPHTEYGALILACAGTYSAMPIAICWFNLNLGGHHRRAIGSAWQIGFGNICGIIATYAFVSTDGPYYRTGYAICVAFLCLALLSCCAFGALVWSENRRRERGVAAGLADLSEDEKAELGDLNPEFRYLL